MWYSSLSTGILEIDTQHGNIDALVQLYEKSATPADEQKWLQVLLKSIENHFDFEEVMFGERFPQDHKEKHVELVQHLRARIAMREANHLIKADLIEFLHEMLFEHVTLFDSKLKDLTRDADPT